MKVVFAKSTTTVGLPSGGVVGVQEGSHWSADDEVVRAHPDLFSEDPRHGMLFSRPLREDEYPPVEQATAAPGERRAAVRRG